MAVGAQQTCLISNEEVGIAVAEDVVDKLGYRLEIFLAGFFHAHIFGILLYCPDSPQRDVGHVDTLYVLGELACVGILDERFESGVAYRLKVGTVVDGEGKAGRAMKVLRASTTPHRKPDTI